MSARLLLYTTAGCHLCEHAEAILRSVVPAFASVTWEPVEISEEAALVAAYGLRIPVVRLEGVDADLGWPFDEAALSDYLSRHTAQRRG